MNGYINQICKTFTQYGFKVLILRSWNYGLFKLKRLTAPKDEENDKRFAGIKGKYAGKRIFILGNGPSLNQMPLYLLKNEYTMCFNRFPLMYERVNWKPNFYAVTDDLLLRDMGDEINKTTEDVDYSFFPDLHPSNLNVKKVIKQRKNVMWLHVDKPEFSDHLPACGINKTVVNAGIQIAAWMGFSEIYLLGVDMTFGDQKIKKGNSRNWQAQGDDPNHFDPRYFNAGRKYHNPMVGEMLEKFEKCKEFFEPRGVNIYNAGFGGKLEAFERKDFDELLNMTDSQKETLFNDAIHHLNAKVSLADFVSCKEGKKDANFFLPTEDGIKLIKDYITTHIPFGPFKGNYYFLKR